MKRLAVAIALMVVALCTPALGTGVYTWEWTQKYYDSAWSNSANLYLTPKNGSHAVGMGYSSSAWWTGVAAEVGGDEGTGSDSITAYEWSGDGKYDENQDGKWGYSIWSNNNEYPRPGYACVAANNSYKLWLSGARDNAGVYRNMCNAASADPLWDQTVDHRDHLTDALHVNYDHWLTGAIFPDNSQRMVSAYTDNYDYGGHNYGLIGNISSSHGGTWSDQVEIEDYQHSAEQPGAPSLAVGSGSDVYIAYDMNESNDSIMFKKSTNYGETWPASGLKLGNGKPPCIAALGSFVIVCWPNSSDKIAYRFSNQGGSSGTWSTEATVGSAGMSHINVSAITCKHHPGDYPGVVLVAQQRVGNNYYVASYFGERFETSHIDWTGIGVTRGYTYADLRPSLTTAYYDLGDYIGRCVHNPFMAQGGKRGIHLRRGTWVIVPGC